MCPPVLTQTANCPGTKAATPPSLPMGSSPSLRLSQCIFLESLLRAPSPSARSASSLCLFPTPPVCLWSPARKAWEGLEGGGGGGLRRGVDRACDAVRPAQTLQLRHYVRRLELDVVDEY